jgi:hypothetical protein
VEASAAWRFYDVSSPRSSMIKQGQTGLIERLNAAEDDVRTGIMSALATAVSATVEDVLAEARAKVAAAFDNLPPSQPGAATLPLARISPEVIVAYKMDAEAFVDEGSDITFAAKRGMRFALDPAHVAATAVGLRAGRSGAAASGTASPAIGGRLTISGAGGPNTFSLHDTQRPHAPRALPSGDVHDRSQVAIATECGAAPTLAELDPVYTPVPTKPASPHGGRYDGLHLDNFPHTARLARLEHTLGPLHDPLHALAGSHAPVSDLFVAKHASNKQARRWGGAVKLAHARGTRAADASLPAASSSPAPRRQSPDHWLPLQPVFAFPRSTASSVAPSTRLLPAGLGKATTVCADRALLAAKVNPGSPASGSSANLVPTPGGGPRLRSLPHARAVDNYFRHHLSRSPTVLMEPRSLAAAVSGADASKLAAVVRLHRAGVARMVQSTSSAAGAMGSSVWWHIYGQNGWAPDVSATVAK